ncbi:MAG: hypothetical protein KIS78_11165 [Labilithrix sp.]|nr:hypothetical protein [Labilithrix sp.]
MIGHVITEVRPCQVHEVLAVERSTTVRRRFVERVFPRAPRYAGRVAVLGGRWTGSVGEGLVIGMRGGAYARAFVADMGDLLGALHGFDMKRSTARVELGAPRRCSTSTRTRRESVAGDVSLPSADRDAEGGDPGMTSVTRWLAAAP